jgi:hypothetical protein
MRVSKQYFNDAQMTDENSLANALLANPAKLAPALTHLGGREDKRFPLTMLTEGAGSTVSINRSEYEYNVTTRVNHVRPLATTTSGSDVGKGGAQFSLVFPDKWFIKDYVLISQSGTQVRIMSQPVPEGANYRYSVRLISPDPTATMPSGDLAAGARFGQLFAPVGTDFSRGNASNWAAPAKVRHKLGTVRKSYQFSGSAKEFVAEFEFETKNGGKSNLWMDYEEWQYMLQWKQECEFYYWYAEQSYDEKGITQMKDENNQPVIVPPGILNQIVNVDTYSELTTNKIKSTIRDLFAGMTDAQEKQITLYTGLGGAEDFDLALKDDVAGRSYMILDQGKFVTGSGGSLSLGGYFTTYQHIDGHTVNVVKVPMFDHGPVADAKEKHPRTGLSLESHRMVFLDQGIYDGKPNVQMIQRKNRELLRWATAGSVVPNGFGQSLLRASDIDGASVHFLKQGGMLLRRFDTSLDLQCVAG